MDVFSWVTEKRFARILLWMVDTITQEIDDIISAKMLHPEIDPELHKVVKIIITETQETVDRLKEKNA